MKQSRLSSFLEQVLNVGSGFFVAMAVWHWVICPLYGIDVDLAENVQITGIFTVVSIARGYVWRRAFVWLHHR